MGSLLLSKSNCLATRVGTAVHTKKSTIQPTTSCSTTEISRRSRTTRTCRSTNSVAHSRWDASTTHCCLTQIRDTKMAKILPARQRATTRSSICSQRLLRSERGWQQPTKRLALRSQTSIMRNSRHICMGQKPATPNLLSS